MAKILLVHQASAFEAATAREAQDLSLALAATEHEVTLLYRGAAVLQLLPLQTTIAVKDFTVSQKLFDLYDIAAVCVCLQSLQQYQLTTAQLRIPVQVVDQSAQQQLLDAASHILVH
ncbi:MAG: DsrE family protein [Rheinheimera sp.]|nr:DsrE family protein [Rheinheimera sp.]